MKLSDYNQMPTVAALMKSLPYFARPDDTVAQIDRLMKQHDIRHVPIKQGEQVVGIISERDLRWMRSPALLLPDPEEIPVAHVQVNNPYTVEITTPLNIVLQEMSERKIGAAVVVKSGELAGIVTVTDICSALAEVLTAQFGEFPAALVIGYGNPDRGDDAIACRVINQLQALRLKNVEVCAVEQLKPELSARLSRVDYAVFVHAGWMKTADVKLNALDACGLETAGSSAPGCGHSWSPCSLLALTHSVYGHQPQSWLVKVAGHNFETGHHLSDEAKQSIQNAVEQIEALIHQLRADNKKS